MARDTFDDPQRIATWSELDDRDPAHARVAEVDLENPDFAAIADNCGGYGVYVEPEDELEEGLDSAMAYDGPALVEIATDSNPV